MQKELIHMVMRVAFSTHTSSPLSVLLFRNAPRSDTNTDSERRLTVSTVSDTSIQLLNDPLKNLSRHFTELNLAPRKGQFGHLSHTTSVLTPSTISTPSTLSRTASSEDFWGHLPNHPSPETLPAPAHHLTVPITSYNSDSSADTMTGDHQMFYGDGRASDPVPLDFLKARKTKFKGLTDEEKIESVLNHLATNSELEIWFYSLNQTTARKDWKLFEAAFETNWPRETVVTVTLAEKRARLTKEKLDAKDVLKLTLVNGVEMTGRAIWIGKIRQLSSQAKDTEGALIGVVYENLPDILKKHMKSEFKDWNEFIKEAQDVKESDIQQSLKEDNRIVALE